MLANFVHDRRMRHLLVVAVLSGCLIVHEDGTPAEPELGEVRMCTVVATCGSTVDETTTEVCTTSEQGSQDELQDECQADGCSCAVDCVAPAPIPQPCLIHVR